MKTTQWKITEAQRPTQDPNKEITTYLLYTATPPHEYIAEFFTAKDATLASAAPEMLEALEDALATCENDMQHILDNGRLRNVIKTAITKAKGQQQPLTEYTNDKL